MKGSGKTSLPSQATILTSNIKCPANKSLSVEDFFFQNYFPFARDNLFFFGDLPKTLPSKKEKKNFLRTETKPKKALPKKTLQQKKKKNESTSIIRNVKEKKKIGARTLSEN